MKPERDNTEIIGTATVGTATVGTATVGRPVSIEGLVLSGSRLEPAADPGRTAAVSVRVVAVAPHGNLFRYDLEATGWEEGVHDLREVLVRADGTTTDDLPSLLIRTTSSLPAGSPRVSVPALEPPRQLGGYGQTLFLLSLLWLVGLALLLQLRRRAITPPDTGAAPLTPADELAALVAKAGAGALDRGEEAAVERLVYEAWRKRLGLEQTDPRQLVAALKEEPAAGAALERLEGWLHAPGVAAAPADLGAFVAELLPSQPSIDGRG